MADTTAHSPDQELARLRRYQDVLVDFSRLAPESSDVDRLLQLAAGQAQRGIDVSHAKVMRHRPEAGDLLIVAGVGWRPGVVGHARLGTDLASPPGQALQLRQPVAVHDLKGDPEHRYVPVLRDHGVISSLNAPIAVDGAVWGVLEVDSDAPRRFDEDETRFLCVMADVLGLALQVRLGAQRTAEAQAKAALALACQGTLLRELQHRNKNDFQLIQALLLMQRRKLKDEQARRGLTHVMDRVAAISMAHDQLSAAGGAGGIELSGYLQALCGSLDQRVEGVSIETALAGVVMPHERAVPLGLILNELVTNALKHAFPKGRTGRVRVGFEVIGGEGCLTVRDDGAGMGPPRLGSSGTELVQRLVQQVGGRMEQIEQDEGAGFRVRFPLVT